MLAGRARNGARTINEAAHHVTTIRLTNVLEPLLPNQQLSDEMVERPQQHAEEQVSERSWIQALAETARSLIDKVRMVGIASAAAGLWLWGVMYYPFTAFEGSAEAVGAVLVGGLMVLPAAILFTFYGGLRELMRLPQRVSEMRNAGLEDAGIAADEMRAVRQAGTSRWTIVRLGQAIWAMRGIVVRHKARLVKYAAAVRLFTAPFLLLVLLSLIVSSVFIVVAAASVPVVLLVALL